MQAESNFNAEITNANRRYARDILVSGDRTRVEGHILNDTGDYIRTVLFGGDTFLESDTAKELDAKAYAKGVVTVETPYQLTRFGA